MTETQTTNVCEHCGREIAVRSFIEKDGPDEVLKICTECADFNRSFFGAVLVEVEETP